MICWFDWTGACRTRTLIKQRQNTRLTLMQVFYMLHITYIHLVSVIKLYIVDQFFITSFNYKATVKICLEGQFKMKRK